MQSGSLSVGEYRERDAMRTGDELAQQLQAAYAHLCHTFGLLEETEIETGRMANGWAPKAMLAHVAFWDDYQTKRMVAAYQGASATTGFARPAQDNDARARLDNDRPWVDILAAADGARQQMIDFARSLDDTALTQPYPEGERTLLLQGLLEHMVRHTRLHSQELHHYAGSLQRWSRAALRAFLVQQHNNLLDGISGLDEATIISTQVCGHWTIRDVLVHLLAWHEFGYMVVKEWPNVASEALSPWLDGNGVDDINANLLADRAELTMIDICDGLMTYHRRLIGRFDAASDAELNQAGDYGWGETGLFSGFFYDLALHDAEHAEDIWRFRAGESKTVDSKTVN